MLATPAALLRAFGMWRSGFWKCLLGLLIVIVRLMVTEPLVGMWSVVGVGAAPGSARRARLLQIAPVNREMLLNDIAAHTLGMPRSY